MGKQMGDTMYYRTIKGACEDYFPKQVEGF
jgi:hypothetical protein